MQVVKDLFMHESKIDKAKTQIFWRFQADMASFEYQKNGMTYASN